MHMPYTAHSGASTHSEQRAHSEQNNIPGGAQLGIQQGGLGRPVSPPLPRLNPPPHENTGNADPQAKPLGGAPKNQRMYIESKEPTYNWGGRDAFAGFSSTFSISAILAVWR